MKTHQNLLVASLLGGLLSTPVLATTAAAPDWPAATFTPPAPASIVHPCAVPQTYRDATVRLKMVIDETGRPRDIRILGNADEALARRLLPAVAQWQFTPARENGVAVAARVILPLRLVEDADS